MPIVQDTVIMPDKYSTGVRAGKTLTDVSQITGASVDTANTRFVFTRVNISALKDAGFAYETDNGATIVFHNILFTGIYLQIAAPYLMVDHDKLVFEDCKIDGQSALSNATLVRGGVNAENSTTNQIPWNRESLVFRHCDFTGDKCNKIIYDNMPVTFDHCKAYEMGSDTFNTDNPYSQILDCYAYNCGRRNTFNGDSGDSHADFIQGQGTMDSLFPNDLGKSKITVRRSRSDIFQYHNSDNDNYYMSNSALYLDTDKGSMTVDADYMWGVSGAYTYRAERSKAGTYVSGYANHLYSGTNWFGMSHINEDFVDCHFDVHVIETILVGSVWDDGTNINISVTNYDDTGARKFKIKTNLGESQEYTLFKCPSATELCVNSGGRYTFQNAVSWESDFPIDKLYMISNSGVEWVQVYDTTDGDEVLVRTEVFSDPGGYDTVTELLDAICEAVRGKDGTSATIRYVDLPSRIDALNVVLTAD